MVAENQKELVRLFSARHEFPTEWHQFLYPASTTGDHMLKLPFCRDHFPFVFQAGEITVDRIELFVKVKSEFYSTHNEGKLKSSLTAGVPPSPEDVSNNAQSPEKWNQLLRVKPTNSTIQRPETCTNCMARRQWNAKNFGFRGARRHFHRLPLYSSLALAIARLIRICAKILAIR